MHLSASWHLLFSPLLTDAGPRRSSRAGLHRLPLTVVTPSQATNLGLKSRIISKLDFGGVGRIRTYVLINVAASATCIQPPHKPLVLGTPRGRYSSRAPDTDIQYGCLRSMPLAHDDIRFVSDCSTPAFHRRRLIIASPRVWRFLRVRMASIHGFKPPSG